MVGSSPTSSSVISPLVGSALCSQSKKGCFGLTTTADRFNMTRTAFSGGTPLISMMQSADIWQLNHSSECGRLNSARNRRVLVQRQMSTGTSVIVEIGSQDPAQTRCVQDDHVVQAFSPYRPDQPLDIR